MPGVGSEDGPTPEEIGARKVIEDRKVEAMTKLRSERDALFPSTDKYAMLDYPINDKLRDKLKWYRQHLRDLPGMSSPDLDEDGNLTGVEWPTFEGIEVKVTPPPAHEKDLETTRIDLVTLQATLEATKTELKADLSETKTDLKADLEKMETRVALLETALTSVYNDINRDWVRYEKVDPKPKNVSIPAEVSNYLVKLQWACALVKEGREVTFQNGGTAKVKEVLDQKNFTVDRSLVDGQDTLERVAVETIKKDDLLNVAVSTVREVSEAILDEGVLKKVDDRLAMLDARLAALENI